ncbi:MAG: hypothetical protein N2V76_03335 [Methanophagales archaeon]|nr:hypothetical protein [Methanophagales archaeon]
MTNTNLIKVEFDGTEIWIETDGEAAEAAVPERVGVLEKAEKFIPFEKVIPFEKFSDTIKAYCTGLVKTFKGLEPEHSPNRISAEFGLKFSGGGNVYIVKSTAECSLKIKVEWEINK